MKKILVGLVALSSISAFANSESEKNPAKYTGIDQDGRPCSIAVAEDNAHSFLTYEIHGSNNGLAFIDRPACGYMRKVVDTTISRRFITRASNASQAYQVDFNYEDSQFRKVHSISVTESIVSRNEKRVCASLKAARSTICTIMSVTR